MSHLHERREQRAFALRHLLSALFVLFALITSPAVADIDPPTQVTVEDAGGDEGKAITAVIPLPKLSENQTAEDAPLAALHIAISPENPGYFERMAPHVISEEEYEAGEARITLDKLKKGEEYFVAVRSVGRAGDDGVIPMSEWVVSEAAAVPSLNLFRWEQSWFFLVMLLICGSVVGFVLIARSGRELKVRRIAGLEAVDEAVGRATEMGKSCLFVPGIQDINEIQTIAGVTVLSRVAETAAEYDAVVEVPVARSLVMATCRETVQASFLSAGRVDSYNPDLIYYVTDEQFGYVAYLSGMMVREEPAACFYMGAFYAESLILAETGNTIGAIQVAGTAMPAQLPFFVAACDYTLIGEEFFAASAYLSGDPDQLGSLKGQDVGKIIVGVIVLIGVLLATTAEFTGGEGIFGSALDYITGTILQ